MKRSMDKIMLSRDLGDLYFGQLNVRHQAFFDKMYGQHTRIRLRDLPHYIFWRDEEYKNPAESLYYKYLRESWEYYYPKDNTEKRRLAKINEYKKLQKHIKKRGVKEPLTIVVAPDGAKIIVSGNHRASIAYHLGLDAPYEILDTRKYIQRVTSNDAEFYGTKNRGVPYQSIFYKDTELVEGRRRDVLKRFQKLDIENDIRGANVLDTGSNIAVNAMLAWHYGAKSVTAAEFSPVIGTSALRLSTLFDANINVLTQDLGKVVPKPGIYDTVFCFSLHAHVGNTANLEKNLIAFTGKVLYFEGHQNTKKSDYEHIFRHFRKVKSMGYNEDGVHSKKATRPLFRCEK
jgi:hypothetical protein